MDLASPLHAFYEIEHRPGVHIIRRTAHRGSMDDLVAAAKTMTHQLAEMTPARGLVVDSRPARPTIELEEYERRVVPLIRSMMGNYKRRAILVASQAAVLHSRRLSAGEDAIGVFLNDLDAAIAYVRG